MRLPGSRLHSGRMDPLPRRDALALLAVLGAGVFLAGLELMITAVALPAIVTDLATWTRLREASWIINGYLLVYVVTMPLAGRLADLWGNRRLFLAALVLFTVGSLLAGAAPTLELLIARPAGPGRGRRRHDPRRDVRRLPPVPRDRPVTGAGRDRRAHVPGHGGRTVPGRRDPGRRPPGGGARAPRRDARLAAGGGPRPCVALGLLRQRAGGDRRPAHRVGGEQRLGDAAATGPRGHRGSDPVLGVPRGIAGGADAPRQQGRVRQRRRAGSRDDRAGPGRPGRGRGPGLAGPRAARPGSVPRSAAVPARGVRVGRPGLPVDRLRAGHGDRRGGGVRGPRPLRRPGRAAARARGAGGRDSRGGAPVRVRGARALAPGGHPRRAWWRRSPAC